MASKYIDINKTLVERCRKGDSRAQHDLYYAYAKGMYNVCMRIVNDTGSAEDILQESFLEAFSKVADLKADMSFGSWLKKIVINRSVNHLRRKKMELFGDTPPGHGQSVHIETMGDDDLQLEVQKVYHAMKRLPDGYRLVLTLYLLEGYDHAEIGQILNITESTSKTQYNRAKAKLRELLKSKDYAGQN